MKIINASWPAPKTIRAFATTRLGGVSQAPYNTLNLAQHVGDNNQHVAENRHRLQRQQQLPSEPQINFNKEIKNMSKYRRRNNEQKWKAKYLVLTNPE